MQGFQGYGYSKDFVKHMGMLIRFFNSDTGTRIQVVTDTDEICSQCPYKTKNYCNKESDSLSMMKNLDKMVIKSAQLKENQIYTIEQVLKLVNTNLDQESLIEICDTCNWKDKCLFYLEYGH